MKLIISEKSSVTKELAIAMGWRLSGGVVTGKFEGEDVTVISASGHLMEMQDLKILSPQLSWNDPNTLLPIPTDRTIVVKKDMDMKRPGSQPRDMLKRFSDVYKKNQISEVIIATDSDREGEAIGWEIVQHLGHTGKIRRAWFSAGVDAKSLSEAMQSLREPEITKSWWRSSEARAWSDWNYIFLTIAYTYYAKFGKFGHALSQGKGKGGVLSLGRVQTPTVNMIVVRELEIKNFIERDHFKVSALFGEGVEGTYKPIVSEGIIARQPAGVFWQPSTKLAEEGKPTPLDTPLFVDEHQVNEFLSRLKSSGNSSVVISYKEGRKFEQPPKTFDLPDAQDAVAKATGINGTKAQTLLEDLYEQGYLSYARTSKAEIPLNYHENPRRTEMLSTVLELPEVSEQASRAISIHNGNDIVYNEKFIPKVYSTKDMEHHGIVPTTKSMTKNDFYGLTPKKAKTYTGDHMRKAYLVVLTRYIQALYPPAVYATQELVIETPVEDLLGNPTSIFQMSSKRVVSLGWKEAFSKAPVDTSLPKMNKGDNISIIDAIKRSSRTTPPKRYTETNITKAMSNVGKDIPDPKLRKMLAESDGIGTPATRSSIIEVIKTRGYVEVKKGLFYATIKGIDAMKYVPPHIKDAKTTALWERRLNQISKLQDDSKACLMRNDFSERQRENVEMLIQQLRDSYDSTLGERIANVPTEITPNMIKAVKAIAKSLNISIPKGALKEPAVASAFISENRGNVSTEPSEAQKKWASEIAESVKEAVLDDEILKSKMKISEFISKYKDKLIRKPTENTIKLLNSLIEKDKTNFKVDPKAFLDDKACSKAIDKLKTLNLPPPSESQKNFIKKIAEVASDKQQPSDKVYVNVVDAKKYIDKYKNLLNSGSSTSAPKKKRKIYKKKV